MVLSKDPEGLLGFVSYVSGVDHKRVEEEFGEGYVRLHVAEAERRQAQHDIRTVEDLVAEFLRNSRDAGASKIFIASQRTSGKKRRLIIIDDGCGIPQKLKHKIFESRVTSKLDSMVFDDFGFHGRGMALYSIKCMVERVQIIQSQPGKGSVFEVIVDTDKVLEIKDQSSFPKIGLLRGRPIVSKGPRNTQRVLAEFALSYPQIEIYYGSSAQILATMRTLISFKDQPDGTHQSKSSDQLIEDPTRKLWEATAFYSDGVVFAEEAEKQFGLQISERNAWRIISGEVGPLLDVSSIINEQKEIITHDLMNKLNQEANVAKYIPEEELEALSKAIIENIREIEQKYYVKIQGKPKVTKSKNRINITLDLGEADA